MSGVTPSQTVGPYYAYALTPDDYPTLRSSRPTSPCRA